MGKAKNGERLGETQWGERDRQTETERQTNRQRNIQTGKQRQGVS